MPIPSRCASAAKFSATPGLPPTRRGLATRRATAAHQGIDHGNGGNLGNSDTHFFGDLGGGMLHGDAPVDGEDDQLENQWGQDGGQEGEEIGDGALAGLTTSKGNKDGGTDGVPYPGHSR